MDKEIANLPSSLQSFSVGESYRYSFYNLPSSLARFVGPNSNLPDGHSLPLTHLAFGNYFNLPVENLPLSLTHLGFGSQFNHPLPDLPSSLTHLVFGTTGMSRCLSISPPFLSFLFLFSVLIVLYSRGSLLGAAPQICIQRQLQPTSLCFSFKQECLQSPSGSSPSFPHSPIAWRLLQPCVKVPPSQASLPYCWRCF